MIVCRKENLEEILNKLEFMKGSKFKYTLYTTLNENLKDRIVTISDIGTNYNKSVLYFDMEHWGTLTIQIIEDSNQKEFHPVQRSIDITDSTVSEYCGDILIQKFVLMQDNFVVPNKIVLSKENLKECANELSRILNNSYLEVFSYYHKGDIYNSSHFSGYFNNIEIDHSHGIILTVGVSTHTTADIENSIIFKDNQLIISKNTNTEEYAIVINFKIKGGI